MHCTFCHSAIDDEAAFCPFCKSPVPGGPTYDEYDYEAFISYRHLPRDRKVAVRLQRRLEGMRVPKGVTSYDGRRRLGKLFRDEDELPTASSLSDQIKEALKRSRRLIVICSPKTNESRWVQREVELYASYHGRDSIRIALVEGEPDESFPTLLRSSLVRDEEGSWTSVEEEPLAADLRSDARRQFDTESLRIAAALIGCGYDDLRQRLHARRMRLVAAATSAVAVISTSFGSFSLWQQRQIERNYRQALANESESLAVDSSELLAHGDRMQAIQVALAALPQGSASNDRPLVPAAQLSLEQALEVYPSFDLWRSCYSIQEVTKVHAWSRDGLQAVLTMRDTIAVSEVETGRRLATIDVPRADSVDALDEYAYRSSTFRTLDFCGRHLVVGWADNLAAFDPATGEAQWTLPAEGFSIRSSLEHSADETRVSVCSIVADYDDARQAFDYSVQALVVNAEDGTVEHRLQSAPTAVDEQDIASTLCVCRSSFSPDGTRLAVSFMGRLVVFDLEGDTMAEAQLSQPYATDLLYADGAIVALSSDNVFRYTSMDLSLAVDVYDEAPKKLWTTTERPVFTLDAHANYGEPTTMIADVFDDDRGGRSVAIAAGRDVIVYQMDSGTEANRYSMESPVTTCAVSVVSHRLFIITRDGSVTVKLPDVEQSDHFTSYWDQSIGSTEAASVLVANGSLYILAYDGDLSSYRAFRYSSFDLDRMPSFEQRDDITDAPSWRWREGTPLIGYDDDAVMAYDATSFERLWTLEVGETALADRLYSYGLSLGKSALYLFDPYEQKAHPILRLSLETGEVEDSFVLAPEGDFEALADVGECKTGGRDLLIARYVQEAAVMDLATHEVVQRVRCTSDEDSTAFQYEGDHLVYREAWSIDSCTVANDAILLFEERGSERRIEVFSLAEGTPLSADVMDYAVSPTADKTQCFALDDSDSLIAVLCSDGMLRLFDARRWSLVWESDAVPATTQRILRFSPDSSSLVVQDLSGSLMLVSALDGSILRTSTTTLPPIGSCILSSQDPNLLLANYQYASDSGELKMHGIASISLDEQTFGPQSDFPYGFFWSPDAARVLVSDSGRYGTVHHYTLDELIDLAHQTIEGHELTEAERYLYRIAQ